VFKNKGMYHAGKYMSILVVTAVAS